MNFNGFVGGKVPEVTRGASPYVQEFIKLAMGPVATGVRANTFVAKKCILNGPATIVIWADGTKTIVKCQNNEAYDREKGVALCYMKRALGNKGNFNNTLKAMLDMAENA